MIILVGDDDIMIREALVVTLGEKGHTVLSSEDPGEIYALAEATEADVVISDYDYGHGHIDGVTLLLGIQEHLPTARLILFSGLNRDAPEGIEQFTKDRLLELLQSIGHANE